MMYPFITLTDRTEIVHSDLLPDNKLIIYVEKPVGDVCFHYGVLRLPEYCWVQVKGFTQEELDRYFKIIKEYESQIYESAEAKRKKMKK